MRVISCCRSQYLLLKMGGGVDDLPYLLPFGNICSDHSCHSSCLLLVNREGMPPHIFSELEKLQLSGSIEFPSGECKEGDVDDLEKRVSVPIYHDSTVLYLYLLHV